MSTKKILYLRTDYCKEKLIAGGSVSHTIGVIEGLLHAQYEVVIAAAVMVEQLRNLNRCKVYELTLPKCLQWLKWKVSCIISNIFFTYQAARLLQTDITYLYQRYSILNCTGVIVSKIYSIPLLLEYNGSEVWLDKHWARKKFIKLTWLVRFFEWINIHYAHKIIVVSQPLKDELIARKVDPNKILVNPNGVNTQKLNPEKLSGGREKIRAHLGLNESFVFGFIGTFSQWHGINVLAAMIPEVINHNQKTHFLLIGDGPLLAQFKEEVAEYIKQKKVTCTGLLCASQAHEYLAACDAFLSPTQPNADGTPFFGSPTKLFEYLSLAKPIIASDLDQVAEVIFPAFTPETLHDLERIDQQTGIVIPPRDIHGFIHAACCLIEASIMVKKKLGVNARHKALTQYDWNIHVKRILEHAP